MEQMKVDASMLAVQFLLGDVRCVSIAPQHPSNGDDNAILTGSHDRLLFFHQNSPLPPAKVHMSTFGSPGGRTTLSKPSPPERGSFPLDHEGECKSIMTAYLKCIKSAKGINKDECRMISKGYLQCRMDRNLMAVDEMKNLGFVDAKAQAREQEEEQRIAEETRRVGGSLNR